MRRFTSVNRRVAVDECPGCGGVWLDAGELGELRSEYATPEARAQGAGEHLEAAFGQWMSAEQRAAEKDQKAVQEFRDKLRGLPSGGGDFGSLDAIGIILF
jgi:Zn-finger nucleic acid-binding protein